MVWFILKHIFATFFDLINIRQLTNQEKVLEILILRQQLSILQRKLNHPIKPSHAEKNCTPSYLPEFIRIEVAKRQ